VSASLIVSLLAFAVWIYLLAFRGMFWLFRERDTNDVPTFSAEEWPTVVAVVPARDEADVIERSIGSLALQDYPGDFRIVVVDDQSSDGTAERVRAIAGVFVVEGAPRPDGWTGKLWALHQGVNGANALGSPDYFWFTDADIVHTPDNLRQLIARAASRHLAMVSLMARLNCESFAERFLIPAFVFFFAMLFPFRWVNGRGKGIAAGAGGCMLVERDAFERAGGIEAVRQEIIDDCALARRLKRHGPIWIGLTERAISIRRYETLGAIRSMVARSAYAQLHYSPALVMLTLFAMALTYAAPPFLLVFGAEAARLVAGLTSLGMIVAFQPMLRFYGRNALWATGLPLIGAFYAAFTVDSAIQFARGRGGMWKGRVQVPGEHRGSDAREGNPSGEELA
jgi:hopene-associated glycosyltransferase HpnB